MTTVQTYHVRPARRSIPKDKALSTVAITMPKLDWPNIRTKVHLSDGQSGRIWMHDAPPGL